MNNQYFQKFTMVLILLTGITINCFAQAITNRGNAEGNKKIITQPQAKEIKYKVTFIELGSVRCIPCQKMQLVMRSIGEKYGDRVKVIFYDIWTPEGRPFADKYKIQVIPSQIFLGEDGKEFFRHEGYFAENDLVKVLNTKGVH
jgi:thioredoxin 1